MDDRSVRVEVRGKDGRYTIALDGQSFQVDLQDTGRDFVSLLLGVRSYEVGLERRSAGYTVLVEDDAFQVGLADAARGGAAPAKRPGGGPAQLLAPMPGKIVRVLVEADQEVAAGQGLVVMEAMKMENELRSPRAGRVREIRVREGQAVETAALLAVVE